MRHKHEESIGKKFGKLTVIKDLGYINSGHRVFECQCECGVIKNIRAYGLYDGTTTSCGCYQRHVTGLRRLLDLRGKRFGKLVALESKKVRHRVYEWKCQCDCGNIHYVETSSLTRTNHSILSCGCLQCPDITGQRFGQLVVLGKHETKNKRGYWKAKCDCGQETIVQTAKLNNGHTQTCGCSRLRTWEESPMFTGCGKVSGKYFSDIKAGALSRNLKFEITVKDMWDLFVKQEGKCALSKIDIHFENSKNYSSKTASLDRIDSLKGYTIDNIQWVHKDVNYMKMDLSQEKFINYCKLIAKANENK
jgi:hypothetical protein